MQNDNLFDTSGFGNTQPIPEGAKFDPNTGEPIAQTNAWGNTQVPQMPQTNAWGSAPMPQSAPSPVQTPVRDSSAGFDSSWGSSPMPQSAPIPQSAPVQPQAPAYTAPQSAPVQLQTPTYTAPQQSNNPWGSAPMPQSAPAPTYQPNPAQQNFPQQNYNNGDMPNVFSNPQAGGVNTGYQQPNNYAMPPKKEDDGSMKVIFGTIGIIVGWYFLLNVILPIIGAIIMGYVASASAASAFGDYDFSSYASFDSSDYGEFL